MIRMSEWNHSDVSYPNFQTINKSFGEISKRLPYFSQDQIKEFSHFWYAFCIDPQEIKDWKDSIILANIDDD